MKKKYSLLGMMFLIIVITGCTLNKEIQKNDSNTSLEEINKETKEINNLVIEKEGCNEIIPIASETIEWSSSIAEQGELLADFNGDGKVDQIKVSYTEQEGSQYISEFDLKIEGNKGEFVIKDYDASFERIELFDFNQDNIDEIVLMFNTRGGGGEGTHEIYVLWIEPNDIEAMLLYPYVKGVEDKVLSYNIDGIYSLEKIEYQGEIRLLTRQYMWGENGHSDRIGDLVSIVSTIDGANEAFIAEEVWIDKE